MSHTYISGFGGSVTFNSTTLDVESWSAAVSAEALDTTNTGDAGWESNITGVKKLEGSFKTFWDSATDPYVTFTAGASSTMTLPFGNSGKSFSFTARLTKVSSENAAKGVCTFECDFISNGAVTMPT